MVNRPKQIGTAAETAVVTYARIKGHPDARRIALAGAADQGDVWLADGIVLEVKSGHAAETASDAQVSAWWLETLRERRNAGARVAALVTKRKGVSGARCGAWGAWIDIHTLLTLTGAPWTPQTPSEADHGARLVRMSLDSLLALTTTYTTHPKQTPQNAPHEQDTP